MREIKFRAWSSFSKKMINGIVGINLYIEDEPEIAIVVTFNNKKYEAFSVYKKDIMQYTGLKDKNGKEIYEWDIIRDVYGHLNVIIFNKTLASYQSSMIFKEPNRRYATTIDDGCEIIGNIHDNPELLSMGE